MRSELRAYSTLLRIESRLMFHVEHQPAFYLEYVTLTLRRPRLHHYAGLGSSSLFGQLRRNPGNWSVGRSIRKRLGFIANLNFLFVCDLIHANNEIWPIDIENPDTFGAPYPEY